MNYLEIRQRIQSTGYDFFEKIRTTNDELGNIAGEFMRLNVEYVLNHQGLDETYGARDILQTGFTKNQKNFLDHIRLYMEEQTNAE